MKINYPKLGLSLAIPVLGGSLTSLLTVSNLVTWYPSLLKPSFTPPNWVFAPIWTVLYLMMGAACYLVWEQAPSMQRMFALRAYTIQLGFNFLWSFLFFYLHRLDLTLIDSIWLWTSILVTILAFAKINRLAGYLLIPYLLWVTFANYLFFTIWTLNR